MRSSFGGIAFFLRIALADAINISAVMKKINGNSLLKEEIFSQNKDIIQLEHIFAIVSKNWRSYLLVMFCITFLSFVLSVFLPKTYQVESVIFPPDDSDIRLLDVPLIENKNENDPLTADKLFSIFVGNLHSLDLQNRFFVENSKGIKIRKSKPEDDDAILPFSDFFSKGKLEINFETLPKINFTFVRVKCSGKDPKVVADLLNEYIQFVDRETVQSVVKSIKVRVSTHIQTIHDKIKFARVVEDQHRKNEILKITENLKIAQRLKIIENFPGSLTTSSQVIESESGLIKNRSESPGYLKGVNILRAELDTIINRKGNDPYTPGLIELLAEEKQFHQILELSFDEVNASKVDNLASPFNNDVKPNRILLVCIGLFFSVILCVFIVLIKAIYCKFS